MSSPVRVTSDWVSAAAHNGKVAEEKSPGMVRSKARYVCPPVMEKARGVVVEGEDECVDEGVVGGVDEGVAKGVANVAVDEETCL